MVADLPKVRAATELNSAQVCHNQSDTAVVEFELQNPKSGLRAARCSPQSAGLCDPDRGAGWPAVEHPPVVVVRYNSSHDTVPGVRSFPAALYSAESRTADRNENITTSHKTSVRHFM